MDDEILQEFWVDTQSHIDAIEECLLHLDKDGSRSDLIDDIFRRVHSVKGNAGVLGLMEIYTYGQEFESFLEGVRERRNAVREEVDHMFEGLDRMKTLVYAAKGEAPPAIHGDVEPAPAPAAPAPPAPTPVAQANASPTTAPPKKASPAPSAPTPFAAGPAAQVATVSGAALASAKARAVEDESITFLVFSVSDERYGVEIMKVREIILMEPITPVPNTLRFVVGVMNLRDQVIPVFDLRKKLKVVSETQGGERNIIVVEIDKIVTGLMVDDVNGIMSIPVGRIESPTLFEGTIETDYLYGLGNTEEGAIILLDASVLCAPDEILF